LSDLHRRSLRETTPTEHVLLFARNEWNRRLRSTGSAGNVPICSYWSLLPLGPTVATPLGNVRESFCLEELLFLYRENKIRPTTSALYFDVLELLCNNDHTATSDLGLEGWGESELEMNR